MIIRPCVILLVSAYLFDQSPAAVSNSYSLLKSRAGVFMSCSVDGAGRSSSFGVRQHELRHRSLTDGWQASGLVAPLSSPRQPIASGICCRMRSGLAVDSECVFSQPIPSFHFRIEVLPSIHPSIRPLRRGDLQVGRIIGWSHRIARRRRAPTSFSRPRRKKSPLLSRAVIITGTAPAASVSIRRPGI